MLPALFLSHGAPDLLLRDAPARDFLAGLGSAVPRPRAILVVSAHWETAQPLLSATDKPETIHDFGGFPDELYRIRYPAPGAPEIARTAADLLRRAGIAAGHDQVRGLDHGAWVPLLLMHPEVDIPVLQLSIQPHLGPRHHLALGAALGPLLADGVLLLASGSFTHDLGSYMPHRHQPDAPAPDWVTAFADWMTGRLLAGEIESLLAWRRLAPFAARNHPTDEHLLPLFVALGAGGLPVRQLHASTMHAVLRMDAFAFGGDQP